MIDWLFRVWRWRRRKAILNCLDGSQTWLAAQRWKQSPLVLFTPLHPDGSADSPPGPAAPLCRECRYWPLRRLASATSGAPGVASARSLRNSP